MDIYRIVANGDGYEPQQKYNAGHADGDFWFPLRENGYWLEPDAYNYGVITMHISMPREMAERALALAASMNGNNIVSVNPL